MWARPRGRPSKAPIPETCGTLVIFDHPTEPCALTCCDLRRRARSNPARRISRSVGPAPHAVRALAVRAKVISSRARPPRGKRMATTSRAAPKSRPASFRNLDDQTVGIADQSGGDPGAGGSRKTKSQCGAQNDCPHHHVSCSLCSSQPPPSPL